MRRITVDQIPDHHQRLHGALQGETEDGLRFEIILSAHQRRMNSNEMIRATISAQSRGRPLTSLYVDQPQLSLLVHGRHRTDIEIMPGGYRHGRHFSRSLKGVVKSLLEEMAPEPRPSGFAP